MFWLGLSVPLAYIPNITGRDILTGWIVLSIVLPFFFLQRIKLGVGHYLGLAFLAYATLAILWAPIFPQAIWDLWLLYILSACFLLGASHDPRQLYLGCAIGVGVSTLMAIPQALGWNGIFQLSQGLPAGLFVNRDMFGESAALVSVALICTRQYWPLVLTLPPIVFTGCRSAQLACFVVAVVWLWQRTVVHKSIPIIAIALLGYVAYHHGWDGSEALRVAMWRDTIDGLTLFGHGPGSFFTLYPEFASRTDTMFTRPESAHNDFLELIFEFGLGAIPLFTLLALAAIRSRVEGYILLAFCVIAFFSFPIRIPTEGLLGMVALGVLCRGWTVAWPNRFDWRSVRDAWKRQTSSADIPLEPLHPRRARV